MNDELVKAVSSGRTLLFAGAGLSATLKVPTWDELVAYMAAELGHDPRVLAPRGVNYMTVAEYFSTVKGESGIRELCKKIRAEWNADPATLKSSLVYRYLFELSFPIIYTTNFDQNLEHAFRAFGARPDIIRSVTDIAAVRSTGTQIVKFHGDAAKWRSLVLTERDYFERLSFESPLDIKLRNDVLKHSILFIGYSLRDINMRLLLYKLARLWDGPQSRKKPRSFLLLPRPNQMERAVLAKWGIEVLAPDVDEPDEMLRTFLAELLERVSREKSG